MTILSDMNMKTKSAPRKLAGDDLVTSRLASAQQTVALEDKSCGVRCSNNLIWQRLDSSRAEVCDGGLRCLVMGVEE